MIAMVPIRGWLFMIISPHNYKRITTWSRTDDP